MFQFKRHAKQEQLFVVERPTTFIESFCTVPIIRYGLLNISKASVGGWHMTPVWLSLKSPLTITSIRTISWATTGDSTNLSFDYILHFWFTMAQNVYR